MHVSHHILNFSLSCLCSFLYTTKHNTTSATVAWTYNGGHLPDNSVVVNPEPGVAVLQLSTVREKNAGVYACLAHLGAYRDAVALELDVYGEGYMHVLLVLQHTYSTHVHVVSWQILPYCIHNVHVHAEDIGQTCSTINAESATQFVTIKELCNFSLGHTRIFREDLYTKRDQLTWIRGAPTK